MKPKEAIGPTEARQGETKNGRVLKMLLVSLALAIAALLAAYLFVFPKPAA